MRCAVRSTVTVASRRGVFCKCLICLAIIWPVIADHALVNLGRAIQHGTLTGLGKPKLWLSRPGF